MSGNQTTVTLLQAPGVPAMGMAPGAAVVVAGTSGVYSAI